MSEEYLGFEHWLRTALSVRPVSLLQVVKRARALGYSFENCVSYLDSAQAQKVIKATSKNSRTVLVLQQ